MVKIKLQNNKEKQQTWIQEEIKHIVEDFYQIRFRTPANRKSLWRDNTKIMNLVACKKDLILKQY